MESPTSLETSSNLEKRVAIISLGCPKNLVDSEHLSWLLASQGLHLVLDPKEASIVIVNTCGFIEDAVKEALDIILELGQKKQSKAIETLIVAGCMVQRYGFKLKALLPEVDHFVGVGGLKLIPGLLAMPQRGPKEFFIQGPGPEPYLGKRLISTPGHFAYLKIAEGCSSRCTYCMIPKIRGRHRSYPLEGLVKEARRLASLGVKELILVAQDLTAYGSDLGFSNGLVQLLKALVSIRGLQWIRLMYCNPWSVSEELISLMEDEPKICGYIDMPIQHISAKILSKMGRPGPSSVFKTLERLRSLKRDIAIRTTLMVGFPGEDERDFQALYQFVKDVEFDHLGVFMYSDEKGTKAQRMGDKVPRAVARKRMDELMGLQAKISLFKNLKRIGKEFPVMIEGTHRETEMLLVGRGEWMAPEIDGEIIINKGEGKIGEIQPVIITEAYEYDLIGELLDR